MKPQVARGRLRMLTQLGRLVCGLCRLDRGGFFADDIALIFVVPGICKRVSVDIKKPPSVIKREAEANFY